MEQPVICQQPIYPIKYPVDKNSTIVYR